MKVHFNLPYLMRRAPDLSPIDRAVNKTMVQRRQQLRVSGEQIFVCLVPFLAGLPASLLELHDCGVPAGLKAKSRTGAGSANGGKLFRSHGGDDYLFLRNKTDDGAAAGFSARVVRGPLAAGTQVYHGAAALCGV